MYERNKSFELRNAVTNYRKLTMINWEYSWTSYNWTKSCQGSNVDFLWLFDIWCKLKRSEKFDPVSVHKPKEWKKNRLALLSSFTSCNNKQPFLNRMWRTMRTRLSENWRHQFNGWLNEEEALEHFQNAIIFAPT